MSHVTTSPALREPRGLRGGWRSFAVSLMCVVLGAVSFTINFALLAELYGDAALDALNGVLLLDVVIGFVAAIAVGPVRRNTVANALIVAFGALSAFALPAVVVALLRFGARRSWKSDGVTVALVAASNVGADLWHSHLIGETAQPIEIAIATGVIAVALLLWGRSRATRAALIIALREQAAQAERSRAASAHLGDDREEAPRVLAAPPESITDREWEVARFVAQGLTNAEIAAALYLSETTVKTHLKSVFTKLQVTNRVQLAIRVLEHEGR